MRLDDPPGARDRVVIIDPRSRNQPAGDHVEH